MMGSRIAQLPVLCHSGAARKGDINRPQQCAEEQKEIESERVAHAGARKGERGGRRIGIAPELQSTNVLLQTSKDHVMLDLPSSVKETGGAGVQHSCHSTGEPNRDIASGQGVILSQGPKGLKHEPQ